MKNKRYQNHTRQKHYPGRRKLIPVNISEVLKNLWASQKAKYKEAPVKR